VSISSGGKFAEKCTKSLKEKQGKLFAVDELAEEIGIIRLNTIDPFKDQFVHSILIIQIPGKNLIASFVCLNDETLSEPEPMMLQVLNAVIQDGAEVKPAANDDTDNWNLQENDFEARHTWSKLTEMVKDFIVEGFEDNAMFGFLISHKLNDVLFDIGILVRPFLQFNQQRHRIRSKVEHIVEKRNALSGEVRGEPTSGIQPAQLFKCEILDSLFAVGGSVNRCIMNNDEPEIFCLMDIQLEDIRAHGDCFSERGECVLGGVCRSASMGNNLNPSRH
jgi:hypothetical protein